MFTINKKLKDTYHALLPKQLFGAIFLFMDEFIGFLPVYFAGVALDAFKDGSVNKEFLFWTIVKIVGISIVSYTISVIWMYFVDNAGNYGGYFLRRKIFSSILKKPMSFFEKYTSGDILARTSNDVDFIDYYFGGGTLLLMDSFAYPIVYIATIAYLISWKLTLASVLPFPLVTILYFFTANEIQKRSQNMYSKFSGLSQEILEMTEGIKLIRSFCNEEVRLNKLSKKVKLYFDALYFKIKLDSLLKPVSSFITEISVLIAFCYGSYLVYRGELTPGKLAAFFMFLGLLTWSCIASSFYIGLCKEGLASTERICEILNAKIREKHGSKEITSIENIQFKDFNFRYENGERYSLQNLNFNFKKGERIAVVGKTGSGKTTLIRSLLHIYDMQEGILINGIQSNQISDISLKKLIAYVSQREQVFSDTIYNNVSFFDSSYSEEEVKEVLKLACFDDVEAFPKGIQTQIGERGMSLSGGQRQRLSIARALIKKPSLLILDDSFSAIDSKTTGKLLESFKNCTLFDSLLVVTHKPIVAESMDKIIVLNDGTIEEIGTHKQLIQKGGWYATEFLTKHEQTKEQEEKIK